MGAIPRRKPVLTPLPDTEGRHRSRREASQWCRGQVGLAHRWRELNPYTVFCQVCGKQRWQEKGPSLASQVKALRQAAGFTQEALAERLGISVERIKELERPTSYSRRTIRLDTLEHLADVCQARVVLRLEPKAE